MSVLDRIAAAPVAPAAGRRGL
ncbi:MAG: hypothetical protein JWM31_701, partial [Solirubrobacterales bacterium]|nr:hypothetical protein [Solirubrobacterales bacterium]